MNWLAFILFIAFSFNAYATSASIKSFDEYYNEKIKVSGQFFLGLQIQSDSTRKDLHVLVPDNKVSNVCVEVISVDGTYKAEVQYSIPKGALGFVKLPFPTKYRDRISSLKSDDLAIKATASDNCLNAQETALIGAWLFPNQESKAVMSIRSDVRKDIAYIPSKSQSSHSTKCSKIKNRETVSFDKRCSIDLKQLIIKKKIEVERINLQDVPLQVINLR